MSCFYFWSNIKFGDGFREIYFSFNDGFFYILGYLGFEFWYILSIVVTI